MTDLEALKVEAGAAAVDRFVRSGMRLGLGSGSTAAKMLDALGERLASGASPTSPASPRPPRRRRAAASWGSRSSRSTDVAELDVVIDGADEIDPRARPDQGPGRRAPAREGGRVGRPADGGRRRRDQAREPARRAGAAPGRGDPVRAAGRRAAASRAGVGAGARASTTAARSSPTRATASSTARGPSGSTRPRWRATCRTSPASSSTGSSSGSPRRRSSLRATAFACLRPPSRLSMTATASALSSIRT